LVSTLFNSPHPTQDYTITMYLNQYWTDRRLAFDVKNPNKSMTLTGEFASRIWVPDTFLANDKHSFLHDVTEQNKMVRLYGDGRIIYGMRFTTTLACMMDLHYYPLDVQNCTVEIESYGYPTEDVTMQWKNGQSAVDGADRVKMPQFTLEHFEVGTTTISLSTGAYQRLSLVFRLRRNVGFFVFQTYLPSILIVMLSWVSFWINHEATSARVALGITTVLTMTTISTGVRSSLPRISYVKAIDIYLVMCFVFVFAALLEYAMVNYTYWGARAKRKAKRLKDGEENLANTSFMDNSVYPRQPPAIPMYPPMSPHLPYISRPSYLFGSSYHHHGFRSQLRHRRHHQSSAGNHLHQQQAQMYSLNSQSHHCSSYQQAKRRYRLMSNIRQRAKHIRNQIPRIKDVNKIDKYSRLAFPSLFVLFNLCYWCFYLLTG
uniref:Gamma-aminobutyric acid receptor subunit beta-like n=3 Tax=Macrostomum lignano TaxID=282301 RepID=A0A1I8IKY9_9PLAT